jgi:hypothetical protein
MRPQQHNGTRLNGEPLAANGRRRVARRDEIMLGLPERYVIRILTV